VSSFRIYLYSLNVHSTFIAVSIFTYGNHRLEAKRKVKGEEEAEVAWFFDGTSLPALTPLGLHAS
jgi:hypothetical protein